MKNIQVNMQFNADTSQAQSAIQSLQNNLQSIATTKVNVQGGSIDQAVQSAKQLSQHLAAATDVNTGKINFSSLQASLKSANTDLTTLSTNLLAMGPKGQQAFSQLANAVAHAELSVKKTDSALASLGTTLMNTIKWQAASTLIHGVMSTFSEAVSHIKHLDKALNNIQIVSNKTAEDMANFAKQAQHLSKSLSSTTEEYAKASLIYFQQGLKEEEVLKRTEATIKMAKVTGEAVETVSDQLTAIWNNFDNGSKSLEYYADVLTRLGAETASSTDEIANGLSKFAAVAETVGLSYEYAASALATITAETRQSEEVVGTALKTIFARMEGLKLGETLDDGTSLNQYSTALAKIGVNIKYANGELRDMDDILQDTGERWDTLTKDQQVALAQSVAGIRQYNQFIAMMDNWEKIELNVGLSKESTGTLQEQFEIYQDSVEASEKALQNAKDTLYETLFNADAIKSFNKGLTEVVEIITRLVEKAGGLKGLLEFGGLLILKTLLPQLGAFVTKITGSISHVIVQAKKINEVDKMAKVEKGAAGIQPQEERKFALGMVRKADTPKRSTLKAKIDQVPSDQVDVTASSGDMATQISKEQAGYTAAVLDVKKEYLMIEDQLTEKQKQQYKNYEDQLNAEIDLLRVARERQLASKQAAEESSKSAQAAIELSDKGGEKIAKAARKQAEDEIRGSSDEEIKSVVEKKDQYDSEMQKLQQEEDRVKSQKKSKGQKKKSLDAIAQQKKALTEGELGQASQEYEKMVQQGADALTSSDDFSRTVDFAGAKTKGAASGLSTKMKGSDESTKMALGSVAEAAGMGTEGAGPAVASIENMEQLGALQGQYNADAAIAVDLQGELQTAIGASVATTKKGTKEYEAGNKLLKQTGTFAKKYGDNMKAAAKELQKAGDLTEDQVKAVEELVDKGSEVELEGMDRDKLEGIQKTLGKVEGGLTEAGVAAGKMTDVMAKDMAAATEATEGTFTAVSDNTKQLAEGTTEVGQAIGQLNAEVQKPVPVQPDPYGGLVMGAQGALQAVTGLAMGSQMLATGLQTAFDPEATGIEKLTGLMMTMQGAQSLLTAAQGAYNVVLGLGNIIAAAADVIRTKGLGGWLKEIGIKYLDTSATIVNAVAKIFNAEASKGLAGVIIGVLAVGILLGTMALVNNTKATQKDTAAKEQNTKKAEENAEASKNVAEAAREEMNAAIELSNAYDELYQAYEKIGEGKSDLIKKGLEAIDTLGIENGALLLQQKRYKELNDLIKEHANIKAGKAVDAENKSVGSAGIDVLTKAQNHKGGLQSWGGKVLAISLGEGANDEKALKGFLEQNPGFSWKIDGAYLKASYDNTGEIAYLMQELLEIKSGASAYASSFNMSVDDQEFFKAMQEMSDSGEIDKIEAAASAQGQKTSTSITAAKTQTLSNVESLSDYESAYEDMLRRAFENEGLIYDKDKDSKRGKALIEKISSDLLQDENFQQYETTRQAKEELKQVGSQSSIDYMEKEEGLKKWASDNGYSEEEALDLYFKINPQYYGIESDIEKALNAMQGYLDGEKIIVKYDFIQGAKDALKDTMTSSDWNSFYTQYEELFDPKSDKYIGMSFEDFTNKSASERKNILTSQQGDIVAAKQSQIDAAEAGLVAFQEGGVTEFIETRRKEMENEFTEEQREKIGKNPDWFTQERLAKEKEAWMYADEETKANFNRWAQETWGFTDYESYLEQYQKILNMNNDDYLASQFDVKVEEQKTAIQTLKDEKHLISLQQADADIANYDLDAEQVYETAESLSAMAKSSDELADSLETDAAAAKKVAVEIARFNKAGDDLADNYEDWMSGLKSGKLSDFIEIAEDLKNTYANLLNMDPSDFTDDFIKDTNNLALAQKAAAGDADAYNKLQQAGLADLGKRYSEFTGSVVSSLQDIAAIEGIEVGELITFDGENSELANKLSTEYQKAAQAAIDGGATVAEAKAYAIDMINQAGYNITDFGEEVEVRTVTVTGDLPEGWVPKEDGSMEGPDGQPITGVKWIQKDGGQYTYTQTFTVPKATSFSKKSETFGGKTPGGAGGGGGGGGSKPKKTEKTRKADIVDRYKEINDKIDDIQDSIEDANRAADGLWGPARLKKMREVQKEMGNELKLLREKRKEAKAYLAEDQAALQKAATENKADQFIFDANGNISNYEEVMTKLYNELKSAQDAAGPTTDEKEQEKIDAIQERIDAVKESIELYDTTKEELEDIDNEIADYIRSMQEQYLEQLNLQLEIEITVDDSELAEIEYYLGKMNEDIWSMAESFALMSGQGKDIFNFDQGQADVWFGKFEDYQKQYDDLVWAYTNINPETGETYINQQQFIEKLVELQGEIYGNLQSINELDKSMVTYYGEALSAASEELSKFTDLMDHHVEVLDHYSSLLEIMGKSKDYERMKLISKAQIETAKNSAEVSKANYEMLKQQTAERKAAYDALDPNDKSLQAQIIKQQWLDAEQAKNEAENRMYEDAQTWAEALKTDLELRLGELGDILEEALSAEFGSLDFMMTSLDHAQSLQEEFLTTTNKIYETDKMIRNAQKEIDKTTNQMAKNKLKQFINETTILQEQGKLSQFELDIQQAKYDLLLAEIALKEAQNAKSTVRLQRDSEGNFGYVYTADQGAIDDAQQKFADAQNNLYNISLEGANKYTEQYIQMMQEMNDAVTELWANEELSQAEKEARDLELRSYYYEQLSNFSYLYQVATTTDSRVIDEAWSKDFAHMTTQTETWMKNVSEYSAGASTAFQTYQQEIDKVEESVGLDLESLSKKTASITTESEALTEAIVKEDGLITALGSELDMIQKLTEGYLAWRQQIQGSISDQETLAKKIRDTISTESDDDESNDLNATTAPPTEPTTTPSEPVSPPPAQEPASGGTYTVKSGDSLSAIAAALGYPGGWRALYEKNRGVIGSNANLIYPGQVLQLKSGGYTGAWGSYGKMAMLHEKELVLNAGDTENFLASLEFLHKILEIIDLQTMSNQLGGILSSPGMYNNNTNTVEQNVHIEASFPNAVNHSEIEEAFNNLINTSSQFANKK